MAEEDTGLTVNLPVWVRSAAVMGVPSLITLGLTWWLATTLSGQVVKTNELLTQHEASRKDDAHVLTLYLDSICKNMAKDIAGINRCDSARQILEQNNGKDK